MLLDQFGNEIKLPSLAALSEEEAIPDIGSVRQIQSSFQTGILTPDLLSFVLKEVENGDAMRYLELAEAMEERDLHYAAVLGVRKRAVRSLEMRVDAGDKSAAAQKAAALVNEALSQAAVKEDLIEILDAIGKGYSVIEINWDVSGKNIAIAGLEWRDQRWFEFDQITGRKLLLKDNAGPRELTPFKYVVHFARAKSGLPVRGGLARLAAWAFMFKHYTLKDWAIFAEAYGHPLRLGKFDSNTSPEERRILLRAVRNIGVDMAAIIPRSMEMEIISASGTASPEMYERNARYWDEQISKGILGQVATTDAIAGGHAVGKIHEQVRDDIRDADAEQLAATLTRDLARPLTLYNFGEDVAVPVIRFVSEEETDPRYMLSLMKLAPRLGLRIAQADVYRTFNLKEPEDGEPVLEIMQPDHEAMPNESENFKTELASLKHKSPDAIEALVDELSENGELQAMMEGMIGELLEAISGAESLDQVRDLIEAARELHPEALREIMARSTFMARLSGEVGAEIEGA